MPRYFDGDLVRITADKLKPMTRLWGGTSTMRKDECIACIQNGLANPDTVRDVIASLERWERNALALIKRMGGVIEYQTLVVGIIASGIHPPRRKDYYRDNFTDRLFRRGLILSIGSYSPDYIPSDSFGGGGMLYTDERLLAHVGSPEFRPLDIQSIDDPSDTRYRLHSTVILDTVGILQAIEKIGGLRITQAGMVRANDEKKVQKILKWDGEGVELDGFFFPDPVTAWVSAFQYSDLLEQQEGNHLVLKESPDRFAQRPHGEQVRLLMEGFIRSTSWSELPSKFYFFDSYHGKGLRQGRLALTLLLSALPLDTDAFFSIEDFDQAVFNRIGEDFSLDFPPQRPFPLYTDSPAQKEQALADWRARLRADWLQGERPWLEGALKTWLYFLGLVELAVEDGKVIGFRLTDIGRATFHPEVEELVRSVEPEYHSQDQPIWLVQPNFDIVVYLDRISAPQLAFLERLAERTHTHQYIANYRLTRNSVYQGLERGTSLAELLEGLQAGFHNDLPQNVVVELREWASLRERIILHRSVSLIEFPDEKALQDAVTHGRVGRIVGDRFLLIEGDTKYYTQTAVDKFEYFNYAQALPKNLRVSEDGTIQLREGDQDLIVKAQLDQWAAHLSASVWQLTEESVTAQLKAGRKVVELIGLLNSRLAHSLPPLLDIALRAWAGEGYPIELASVVLLHCSQERLFTAISTSPKMRPYLKGYLPPNLLIIDAAQLEAFRSQLEWLGCSISEQLKIIPLKHK